MILYWTDGLPRYKSFEFRKWPVVLANDAGNEWRTRDVCGWVGEGIVGGCIQHVVSSWRCFPLVEGKLWCRLELKSAAPTVRDDCAYASVGSFLPSSDTELRSGR